MTLAHVVAWVLSICGVVGLFWIAMGTIPMRKVDVE